MMIVGEKLNSSLIDTRQALDTHNTAALIEMIQLQEACGADHLDINTAICGENEADAMAWLIALVTEHSKCGIMLDSPNPETLKKAIPLVQGRPLFINSITLDEKYEPLYEDIRNSGGAVVCLPIKGNRIPMTADERFNNARQMIDRLTDAGIPRARIYIDALVTAVATDSHAPAVTLDTIRTLEAEFPDVSTICGLSNVSFGLPEREALNAAFLAICMSAGLDSVILDITSPKIQETVGAANALLGKDENCAEYISRART